MIGSRRAGRRVDRRVGSRARVAESPGYLLKLDRALGHLDDLDREIRGLLHSGGCRAVEQIDPDTGDWVLRVRLASQPPPELSLVVGDCVHNLRSALDHIAFQLWSNYTKPLSDEEAKRSEFPIFNRRSEFHRRQRNGKPAPGSGLRKISGIDPHAQSLIEAMQPYNGGDWLWLMLLHELDRIDKHRRLNLSVAASTGSEITWAKGVPIAITPPGPVDDGTELVRIPFDPEKHVKPKATATFDVAFGVGQGPGERAWVLYNLRKIDRLVREQIIPPLLPFL